MTRDECLNEMVAAYIECALWTGLDYSDVYDPTSNPTGTEDNPIPLNDWATVDTLTAEQLAEVRAEVIAFADEIADRFTDEELAEYNWGPGQIGHDFALTRGGHGAGFWDRWYQGRGAEIGDELTKMAKAYAGEGWYSWDGETIEIV